MLRIRHLFININTDQGVFGTRRNFQDGLNIIRAENYAGMSAGAKIDHRAPRERRVVAV